MKMLNTCLLVAALTFGVLASCCFALGLRFNTTDSVPQGLYQLSSSIKLKNNYVLFCPDDRALFSEAIARGYINKGLCNSGAGNMIKKVVAAGGDTITINDEGVYVNGKLQPFSKPLTQDGARRALRVHRLSKYKLKAKELLTMTDQNDWSFDGRYFGLIKTAQIKGVLIPIWVKPLRQSNETINKEQSHA